MALMTITAMDCYLRPGEAVGLSPSCVVPATPRLGAAYRFAALLVHPSWDGRPSKVGQFDESLLLDTPGREWLGAALCKLKCEREGSTTLFGYGLQEWSRIFHECARELGAPEEPLYVLRHTGASDDYLRKARRLPDIKKRGRWADDRSVRRYEKSARALYGGSLLQPSLQEHALQCESALQGVLTNGSRAPLWAGVRGTGQLKRKRG